MPVLRPSVGAMFTTIGLLVTTDALVGAIVFTAVWQSVAQFGGRYPPDLLYFLMFPVLVAGGAVTLYGVRLMKSPASKLVLLFPAASLVVMLLSIQLIGFCLPWVQCVHP